MKNAEKIKIFINHTTTQMVLQTIFLLFKGVLCRKSRQYVLDKAGSFQY